SYAPVRARLVREPYRRIRKTSGYAGGYLFKNQAKIGFWFKCCLKSERLSFFLHLGLVRL
ncbi:hypothetical protein, partial [Salmonella enterica]|uniref:hypothetical protein n=2 Tax=Salmonella TaxID=590 RepID=UPI001C3810DF